LKCSKVGALSRSGFTLIEIVVTLCIVAILTAIAIPGFKKATEDFRVNTTLEDTLAILKTCRAYYLIFNEFPGDWTETIPDKLLPFAPGHLIGPSHRWNHKPLGKTAYRYDLDNFMSTGDKPHSMGVSLHGITPGTDEWNKCYNKFKSCLGEKYITDFSWCTRMACFLPECPGSMDFNSNTMWENRYY
jgi:prepilin-type N-terminal cleavage/methylation domain-containing protein